MNFVCYIMEDTRKNKYLRILASLLFGCAVLLFWGLYYPHHLHYQEQFQLFLFTPEYWADKWMHPGGVAEYVAEFFTQFFFHAWAGAGIIAVLLVMMQGLVVRIAARSDRFVWYPLSFLPPLCVWVYLCDQNALLAMPVSLLLALVAWWGYRMLSASFRWQLLYVACLMPLLYWGIGGAYFVFVIGVAADLCLSARRKACIPAVVCVLLGLLYPLLAQCIVQYPLVSLMMGIDYYRFPQVFPETMVLAFVVAAFVPLFMRKLPVVKTYSRIWIAGISVLLLGGGLWGLLSASDAEREEVLGYDYLTRMNRWGEMIRMAEKKEPRSPFAVTCLNLALAKTGQLGDRMFHFYQNGTEGLIPKFQRDFTTPLPASEIFYHLGMINTSQRYAFEAMEAIPDLKKSGRAYMRLAETNLINGQYAVAAKYLRALQHTVFYRRWALNAMRYLHQEEMIDRHPEWGQLRKSLSTEDYLFFDTEMDVMLGRLLQQDKGNRLAFEYLMAYVLQNKDLERFRKYYALGQYIGYDHIPLSYQEALVFMWTQEHDSFQGMPWSISKSVQNGINEFARMYTSVKNAEPILRPAFEKTYWYYFLFRK